MDEDVRVRVGSLVRVQDGLDEDEWRIVPRDESDPTNRLISEDSPMARALLGHRVGERVHVLAPANRRHVLILRCG
jgi:transcription elongation factor GreA